MKYATLLISILIIVAVLLPGSNIPDVGFAGVDKFVHLAMFATWSVAVGYDFHPRRLPFYLVLAAGLSFSFITEALQILAEGRTFDVYDMVADTAGLVIGFVLSPVIIGWIKR